jgi:cobyrinic acid a,c-diamide synthase
VHHPSFIHSRLHVCLSKFDSAQSDENHLAEVAMRHLPRFALGTIQASASRNAAACALLAALKQSDKLPVLFHSSLAVNERHAAHAVLGRASRHLDSWAMSRADAISTLARATGKYDTAIVEGTFIHNPADIHASSLERLATWLDLPRIAIIDVRELATSGIRRLPAKLDGLLLDRVTDLRDAAYWQTTLETLWKTPVIGWLDEASPLRQLCSASASCSEQTSAIAEALGRRLLPNLRIDRLGQIAERAPDLAYEPEPWLHSTNHQFRIAVAMDEAFSGYYPETLDLLEEAGAELCDFSPLRSEQIPAHVELVYFGQANLQFDPVRLAANHCLKQSLRNFAAEGGRVYAQGTGLAYLCQDISLPTGQPVAMTGLLPASARLVDLPATFTPTELTFGVGSWLSPEQVSIRGYRHSALQIESRGPVIPYALSQQNELDILGRGNVIGSRVLINLAANRHLLRRFFEPYSPVLSSVRRREL